ncbi:unnamed protein product [Caenorhabditis bovis]|uniref:Uncharacterized protein n=1 Tax=Caenorhabditis bovis TaxID=2654633 RepID=A0A8S1F8K0_9PELO|nr:unnamed protein product [Caenorhabditis bovis]
MLSAHNSKMEHYLKQFKADPTIRRCYSATTLFDSHRTSERVETSETPSVNCLSMNWMQSLNPYKCFYQITLIPQVLKSIDEEFPKNHVAPHKWHVIDDIVAVVDDVVYVVKPTENINQISQLIWNWMLNNPLEDVCPKTGEYCIFHLIGQSPASYLRVAIISSHGECLTLIQLDNGRLLTVEKHRARLFRLPNELMKYHTVFHSLKLDGSMSSNEMLWTIKKIRERKTIFINKSDVTSLPVVNCYSTKKRFMSESSIEPMDNIGQVFDYDIDYIDDVFWDEQLPDIDHLKKCKEISDEFLKTEIQKLERDENWVPTMITKCDSGAFWHC